MKPLAAAALLTAIGGALMIVVAQASIPGIIADTSAMRAPDLSGPIMWSTIGGGFIGFGALAGLLELLMIEIREAIRTGGVVPVDEEAADEEPAAA